MKRAIAAVLLVLPCAIGIASAAPSGNRPDAASIRNASAQARTEASADKTAAENQLHDLRAQLDALAEQQHEAEGERSDASKALRAADNSVGQATRALHDTEAAIIAQQARLADLEAQQDALKRKLSGQRAELAALVRSAYALGGDEQLKLLLAQDRVVDLARAMQYHRYLEQDRLHRIHTLTDQLRSLADLSKQVDAQRTALAASHQEQVARLATVQSQRQQRSQLIASIDAGYHDRAARIAAMGRDADGLAELVRKLSVVMARTPPPAHVATVTPHHVIAPNPGQAVSPVVAPFAGTGGRFPWPIEGRVLAAFGDGSSGLLIAGTADEEVHAVADGRVAFANWLKGYGLLVIVDHGNGVMSLYANNDALLKNAGDSVHAGEALATVGSSGGQGRNALYFEIRQNGKAVDPRAWLRSR
ncbi:MAG TPA: peptidoglycan DD-metalloendopeptidase family protein [Xanthomonadaceae bacterium]|nr:peptidoglycan DD-metalloendopeptidase family protein [Xanthomonadaceae bacterium]